MKINLRLPGGWSKKIENVSKEVCDVCGACLHAGPGGSVFCDNMHTAEQIIGEKF